MLSSDESCELKTQATQNAIPWYWSGWAFGDADALFLTRENVLAGEVPLEAAREAKKIYVDFFPDELPVAKEIPLKEFYNKMFFLPPRVALPASVGKTYNKKFLLSDGPFDALTAPEIPDGPPDSIRVEYKPLPVPVPILSEMLEIARVSSAADICEVLNAPGWVLLCQSPQIEQALFYVAAQHGIKIDFWQRQYSSPLRALDGYEFPFGTCLDKSLRARVRRVMDSALSARAPALNGSFERVEEIFNFEKLGLSEPSLDGSRSNWQGTLELTLPEPLRKSVFENQTMLSLGTAAQRLPKELPLRGRVWKTMCVDALSRWGTQRLSLLNDLWEADAQLTQKCLAELLNSSFGRSIPQISRLAEIVFQTIMELGLGAQATELVSFWEAQKEGWEVAGIKESQKMRYWAELIKGNLEAEVDEEMELWRGVGLLRKGSSLAEEVLEASFAKGSAPSRTCALRETLLWRSPIFERLWKLQKLPAEGVAAVFDLFYIFGNHAQYRKGREEPLRMIGQTLKKMPLEGCQWLHWPAAVLLGQEGKIVANYQAGAGKWDAGAEVRLCDTFFAGGDLVRAREFLAKVDPKRLDLNQTLFFASLSFALGNHAQGNEALRQIRLRSESFWKLQLMSLYRYSRDARAGWLGAILGDSEMAQAALARLGGEAYRPRRMFIEALEPCQQRQVLDEELREWMMADLRKGWQGK